MKKHLHLLSKLSMKKRINRRDWHLTSGEIFWCSVLVFWELWVLFFHRGCHMSISQSCSKGNQHRKQRKMLNLVFSTAHMREMSKCCSFLLDKSTHWYPSSDILWRLLQGTRVIYFFYFVANPNIILSKASSCLYSSSQRRTSRSLYPLPTRPLSSFSFGCF